METENTPTATVEELNAKVDRLKEDNDWLRSRLDNARETLGRVERYIKQVVADGEVDAEESLITDLCDIMGIELTQEVEVTLTATLTTTVTIPVGKTIEDFRGDIFATFESNDSDLELNDNDADDVEIQEA